MKFLIFLILPLFSFGQTTLETISLLDGKVKISVPKDLKPMSDETWATKYRNRAKPMLAISNSAGEVSLIGYQTPQPATDAMLPQFKDFQIQNAKKTRPDLELLDQGVKLINGKNVGFFKFSTLTVDQKVFQYHFFTILDGKIILFTFGWNENPHNEKTQYKWSAIADQILASLQTK